MATGDTGNTLESCLSILNAKTAHPEQFLSLQDALATDFTGLSKTLYDLHKTQLQQTLLSGLTGSPLDQLVVENFDEEQIWQELELQNSPALTRFQEVVSQVTADQGVSILEEMEEEEEDGGDGGLDGEGDEDDAEDKEMDDDDDDEDDEEERGDSKPGVGDEEDDEEGFSDQDSDLDFDVDALEKKAKQKKSQKTGAGPKGKWAEPSEVDDKFFKLSDMEAFLDDMDRREEKGEDTGEDIDYFQDLASGDEEEGFDFDKPSVSKKQQKQKSSRNLKYKDYFDASEGMPEKTGDEDEDEDEEGEEDEDEGEFGDDMDEEDFDEEAEDIDEEESRKARDALRRVTFDLPEEEEEEEEEESEGEDMQDILGGKSPKADKQEPKSSFEKRQDKMAERISELEEAALEEKPWQLTGEVTAQTRPENSLLEEDMAFDQASRMAPAITEETTMNLEEIIKQRIKDQVFDDVVRKEKPKEDIFEYKKRLTLDHEKSKLSLAEVYEQEYVKLTEEKTEEEENPAHKEIQKMMDVLFLKLDALSNFHFTPKPAIPEVKVVSNLPSIAMEEVAPVSASDATLLAPEEIKDKNKAGDAVGATEKTATDKKRERRKKKKLKHLKLVEKEKRMKLKAAAGGGGGGENQKVSKAQAADTLKKLTKGGKAKILTNDGMDKALRSSQAFFSQLQDQVKSQIKGSKDQNKKKKKNDQELNSSKLKL
ncbi:U3 small nucleolar ribonucleoprotein protein MPP10 [Engraulis encrasicolus]|uniref:U3 small nucleolar ribonucleoprotein protein MPP10 n=1 Tax=Engraulis encrasicolus TaxID=184585 RepID=UPI002FD76425